MKSWENLEADIVRLVPVHYTRYVGKRVIRRLFIHHNAGNLTVEDCFNAWLSREASAHYQVQSDGVIGQLVWDNDIAWHAGNANQDSIGIEVANSGGVAEGWPVSDVAVENAAHLVAALCLHYKLGKPESGKNVFYHKDVMSTACPGNLAPGGNKNKQLLERAAFWYEQMSSGVKGEKVTQSVFGLTKTQDRRLNAVVTQLTGSLDPDVEGYKGWPQLGGRTVVDALAAIGEKLGVEGFKEAV